MDDLPPPFVSVPGLANIRDIGGWPIADSDGNTISTVRRGLVYRGPDPSQVTAAGLAKLKELGITISFDIRSKQQIDRAGGYKELEGIRRIWCPVFGEDEYTPEKAAIRYQQYSSHGVDGIVRAFGDILTHGAVVFRKVLLHIASLPISPRGDSTQAAILIHCTTGNNRTGVFVGILLSLLRVPPASIASEYALSQLGLAPSRPAVVARLLKNPIFNGDRARCERMVGAREESMLAMLESVKTRWGSSEGYVRECCGLSKEEVNRVRKVLGAQYKTPSLFRRIVNFLIRS